MPCLYLPTLVEPELGRSSFLLLSFSPPSRSNLHFCEIREYFIISLQAPKPKLNKYLVLKNYGFMQISIQAQVFYEGVRAFVSVLTTDIQEHPNFKKVTEGLDLSLSIAIRTPESFKQFNIADTYVHLHIVNQQLKFDVDREPFRADVTIEGGWDTWKNIFTGQENIIESVMGEKIKIEILGELKINIMDLFSILAEVVEKSKVPTQLLKFVEPT